MSFRHSFVENLVPANKRLRDSKQESCAKTEIFSRADAKASAVMNMMEPPPPKPLEMSDVEPLIENGKLPYAAAKDNYAKVHQVIFDFLDLLYLGTFINFVDTVFFNHFRPFSIAFRPFFNFYPCLTIIQRHALTTLGIDRLLYDHFFTLFQHSLIALNHFFIRFVYTCCPLGL